MRTALVLLLSLLLPAGAAAQTPAELAPRLAAEVVVTTTDALGEADAGRLRLQIVDAAIGRITIGVVPEEALDAAGGPSAYANAVDAAAGGLRGALLVTDGARAHVVTSYDLPVAAALEAPLSGGGPLVDRLSAAVRVLAALDPGRAGDVDAPGAPQPGVSIEVPDALAEGASRALLVVAVAVAVPFLLGAAVLAGAVVRRRRRAASSLAEARAAARERLVAVAGAVTEEEASEGPAYAVLLDRYERAEALVDVPEPSAERLARAAPLLDEAEQAVAELLRPAGAASTPAAPG